MNYRRSLGRKFSLVLIVTIALFGISAVIVGQGLELVKHNLEQKDVIQAHLLEISELSSLYKSKEIALHDYRLSQDEQVVEQFHELSNQFQDRLSNLIAEGTTEQKQRLELILENDTAYNTLFTKMIVPNAQNTDMNQEAETATKIRNEILTSLNQLLDEEKLNKDGWTDQTYSQLKGNTLVLIFSIVISAIVGLTLVLMVSRNVKRSLHEVVYMADEIANKNLHIPDMDYYEEDEIGQLVDAMNRMKWTLRRMLENITNTSKLVSDESKKLIQFTRFVGTGSGEITTTMQQLSTRSDTQADTSSQLVDRMDHYSEQILAVVDEKEHLSSLSNRMLALTVEGSVSMESSIEKMNVIDDSIDQSLIVVKGLDEKTEQISTIVSVIDNIANQTRMLSLNAAIEAARAGEHGRTFTIVANNVRKLSEQVQASVEHITSVVADIQSESKHAVHSLDRGYRIVTDGKKLVDTTSRTFLQLKEEIDQIGMQIESMSSSLDEVSNQTIVIHQFLKDTTLMSEQTATGVSEVSSIAGEFNDVMEEVGNSVSYLDQEADKLNIMINQFKI